MGAAHLPSTEFETPAETAPETIVAPGADTGPADMVQMLGLDGVLRADTDYAAYTDLEPERLRGFYRDMAMIRRFDQEATALQRQGLLALWVPLTGQEAAQIGSGRATKPQDYIFPTYREHGVALTRGVKLVQLLRLFRGVSNGGWDPRDTNFHLYTLVLAAQTLHAVGYAMGIQRDQAKEAKDGTTAGQPAATVAYFGDGASSEGDVHESMVFAAFSKAPVVFFCQNNHWAISVPSSVQSQIPLASRAQGYGFPGVRVDGNDVVAVHAVTQWALEHARSGKGPVLIEAFTYRVGAHTTADDPTKYRLSAEEDSWRRKDPLLRLETYLRAQDLADDGFFADTTAEGNAMATRLREDTLAMDMPSFEDNFANVYAEAHPLVAEELAWHRVYQAGFTDTDTTSGPKAGR